MSGPAHGPHPPGPATTPASRASAAGGGRAGAGATTRSLQARPEAALPREADDDTKRGSQERSAAAADHQREIDRDVFGWSQPRAAGPSVVQRKPLPTGKIDPGALLPPFMHSVLLDGDVSQVADLVTKQHGDVLKAAFEFLRDRRGLPFVDALCRKAYPSTSMRKMLGIQQFLAPDITLRPDDETPTKAAKPLPSTSDYPVLPPDLVDVLTDGFPHTIAVALRKKPQLVDAAYAFLRDHHDEDFIEQVSDELFPRHADTPIVGKLVEERLHGNAKAKRDAYLNSEVSRGDLPEVDENNAFQGIELYIKVDQARLSAMDRMPHPHQFGPGEAGPYRIHPCTRRGFLLGFIARHKEREQSEWVIGPESIDAFAAAANMYAGAASTLLPGAPVAPSSMLDGADTPHTPDSVLRDQSKGEAPWQDERLRSKVDGAGGPALNAMRNGVLRIGNYAIPVKMLANRIEADVNAGKLHHLVGRSLAANGRNDALTDTRGKISTGAKKVSRRLKEEGKSLSELEAKSTDELLSQYRGKGTKRGLFSKKTVDLTSEELADVRARLDADSPLWGQHARALDAGGDPAVYRQRLAELGRSKEVSMEIIRSAGRPRGAVTAVGAFGVVAGAAFGGVALEEAYYNIVEADEGDKLHAMAREFAGFAGGVLAAEGAVWIASALVPAATANPVALVVVSMFAGIAGGMLGSYGAMSLVDLMAEASLAGAMPATAFSSRGGLAGVHEADKKHGQNLGAEVADRIWALDEELRKYDQSIQYARSEKELDSYRRDRVDILARRAELEELLTAIKLGVFENDEPVSRPFEELPVPEIECAIDLLEQGPLCDDDCDTRFD
ncbi:MAG: hypothetical protein K8M05_11305 [Deltaproteobacteria bacterium]|nr:hypothetical protein [Kofleriaceae bacterium]